MRPQTPTRTPTPNPTPAPARIPGPTPLTPRQERFCQAFVVYATAATAAAEAGYARTNTRQYGSRLLKTDRIRARIREIQSDLAADHGRDIDVLLGKLEIVYRRAIEDHHFYAAARAVELQAKLGGMAKLPPAMIPGDTPAPPLMIPGDTPAPPGIEGEAEPAPPVAPEENGGSDLSRPACRQKPTKADECLQSDRNLP